MVSSDYKFTNRRAASASLISKVLLTGSRQAEYAGVGCARVEADELFISGAPYPIEYTAVFWAEIGRALEQNRCADLASFHLDRVFIRPSAVSFEAGLPYTVFRFDLAVELLANVLGRFRPAGRAVDGPRPAPGARYVGSLYLLGRVSLRATQCGQRRSP